MQRTLKAFTLVAVAFAGGLVSGSGIVRSSWASATNAYDGLNTLARAMTTIESSYVEELQPLELVHSAVQGMVDDLDPHSVWLPPEEYQRLQERADGRYLGIGIELGTLGEVSPVIDRVLPRGPAALAGIQPGDVLTAIDGVEIATLTSPEVLDRLNGPQGASVQLTLLRGDVPVTLTVVRDEVLEISVEGALLADGWGYLRLKHFSRRVAAETAIALADLEKDAPLSGVILDLRDNPGGLITEAVELVDLFVSEGLIVQTRGRDPSQIESFEATAAASDRSTLPIVVLVNGGSASASELVAGALQDIGRATVIGEPTYGKGSMQHVYEFEDGSALKLTVARYYLPGGESIQPGVGVTPDVHVALSTSPDQLRMLQEEVAGLSISAAERQRLEAMISALPLRESAAVAAPPWTGTLTERLDVDPQLRAAWEHLRRDR
ncbi:MAG: carboxyl-terminal processing protease [Myxococcota bacterium]|jgi:carboxyl-terminal processing protease